MMLEKSRKSELDRRIAQRCKVMCINKIKAGEKEMQNCRETKERCLKILQEESQKILPEVMEMANVDTSIVLLENGKIATVTHVKKFLDMLKSIEEENIVPWTEDDSDDLNPDLIYEYTDWFEAYKNWVIADNNYEEMRDSVIFLKAEYNKYLK